jgi:hypothetical protein
LSDSGCGGGRFDRIGLGDSGGGRFDRIGLGDSGGGRFDRIGLGDSGGGRFDRIGLGDSGGGRFDRIGLGDSGGGRFDRIGLGDSGGGRFDRIGLGDSGSGRWSRRLSIVYRGDNRRVLCDDLVDSQTDLFNLLTQKIDRITGRQIERCGEQTPLPFDLFLKRLPEQRAFVQPFTSAPSLPVNRLRNASI